MSDKKAKSSVVWKIFDVLIPVACLIVFIIGGIQLVRIRNSYDVAVKEYDALKEYAQAEATEDTTEEPEDIEEDKVRPHFLEMDIDFASLQAVNIDVVGWLYLPALDLSYPVVKGEDNDYYLKHTYENTPNNSGSIFLDCDSRTDMQDRNTFIYGHNMRNGSMFGSMKKFRSEPELVDKNPYVYYYTPERAYKYKIFAFYITKVGGEAYFNFMTDAQYDDYMAKVHTKNEYAKGNEQDLSTRKNILTLSTCSGSHSKNRMVTHCVLVDQYKIEE